MRNFSNFGILFPTHGKKLKNQDISNTLITFQVYPILLKCLIEIKYFDIPAVEIFHFIQLTRSTSLSERFHQFWALHSGENINPLEF